MALGKRYDVGIVGIWSERNYGSELTYYALYEVIKDRGFQPLMIERPKSASWGPNPTPVLFKESPYPDYSLADIFQTKNAMYMLNKICDTFIIGSDQLWNHDLYKCFGEIAYLDFILRNNKKIAYATSFGHDYWIGDESTRKKISYFLSRFDAISVREKSGVKVSRDCFDIYVDNTLDPILLCDKEKYLMLASKSTLALPKKYLSAYILDITEDKMALISHIAEALGISYVIFSDAAKSKEKVVPAGSFMEDWLNSIINSSFVVTDSFHGMCLAILFCKPFIAIANKERGIARFTSLIDLLNLQSRLIYDITDIISNNSFMESIDYEVVNAILNKEINRSSKWLLDALSQNKSYHIDDLALLEERISELAIQVERQERDLNSCVKNDRFNELVEHVKCHEDILFAHGTIIPQLEQQLNKYTNRQQFDELVGHVVRHEDILVAHGTIIPQMQEQICDRVSNEQFSELVNHVERHENILVAHGTVIPRIQDQINDCVKGERFNLNSE